MELSDKFHAPASLSPGNSPGHTLFRGLDVPRGRSGHGGEDNNPTPFGILIPFLQP